MAGVQTPRRRSAHPPVGSRVASSNDDFFDHAELRTIRDYIRPLRRSRRIRAALAAAVDVVLIFVVDLPPAIASRVDDQGWAVQVLAIALVMDLITAVVRAPFSFWSNLIYEKRAGHSTMTLGVWLKDQLLEYLLELFIVVIMVLPLYAAIHTFDQWWLIGAVGFVVLQIALQFIAPVVIMPRFNKFTPLEPGPIRSRIEELARMSEVDIQGVYLMDASKRTTRANAGVTGFGKTKRVIVNDTICDFPLEELSQVIAHELGHYRLNHTVKLFPLDALQLPFVMLFVQFVAGTESVLSVAGVDELGDPASYGLLMLAFGVAMTVASLPAQWLRRKHEREADLEALELLVDPTSFISVWPRIVLADKANLEPTWWEKAKSTHPEIAERMQFGIEWARMNDVPVTMPERRAVSTSTSTSTSTTTS